MQLTLRSFSCVGYLIDAGSQGLVEEWILWKVQGGIEYENLLILLDGRPKEIFCQGSLEFLPLPLSAPVIIIYESLVWMLNRLWPNPNEDRAARISSCISRWKALMTIPRLSVATAKPDEMLC